MNYLTKKILKVKESKSDFQIKFDYEVIGKNKILAICSLYGIDDNNISIHLKEKGQQGFQYVNPLEDDWVLELKKINKIDIGFAFTAKFHGDDIEIILLVGNEIIPIININKKNYGGYEQTISNGMLIPNFITGPAKSGTTLVELILNAHPDCLSIGEENIVMIVNDMNKKSNNKNTGSQYFSEINIAMEGVEKNTYYEYGIEIIWRQNIINKLAKIMSVKSVFDKSIRYQYIFERICNSESQVIICSRNPLDIVISRAHHEANLYKKKGALSSIFELYNLQNLNDDESSNINILLNSPYFIGVILEEIKETKKIIRQLNNNKNFYHFIFENYLEKPKIIIKELLYFANLYTNDEIIENIFIKTHFKNLQKNIVRTNLNNEFFRSGESNQKHDGISDELLEYIKNFEKNNH